jgi:hypothetical protein
MNISTIYENGADGSMTLKFLVDGVEKTNYVFGTDGCITMYERNEVHVNTYESFHGGLQLVRDWVNSIKLAHKGALRTTMKSKITKYSLASQYMKDGNIKCVFKLGKTKVINTVYDVQNQLIRFSKRPTVKMCFKDFENLLNYQMYMGKLFTLMVQSKEHLDTDLDDEI